MGCMVLCRTFHTAPEQVPVPVPVRGTASLITPLGKSVMSAICSDLLRDTGMEIWANVCVCVCGWLGGWVDGWVWVCVCLGVQYLEHTEWFIERHKHGDLRQECGCIVPTAY